MTVGTTRNGAVRIAFETLGPRDGRPLLLVMGLDSPMQWWPDGFCTLLAEHGFLVARFDNRDSGLSGRCLSRYTAMDMVDDEAAVLDALGWPSAHVVGASLGASLALGLAVRYPERVRTIVTLMGLPAGFGAVARQVRPFGLLRLALLTARHPATAQEDLRLQAGMARMLASPAHPFDEQWAFATARAVRAAAPGDPGAARRQLAAMGRGAGLLRRAGEVTAPLLAVQGADDPLIRPSAAAALVRQVPDAQSVLYAGMGHEIPQHLWAAIAGEIARHADRPWPAGSSTATRPVSRRV
ncbi:alpha/beta fold hydrolase [Streptacidiphilus sp. EB129]|uniref:alpha/beta fold hydrolase n=1 Tax=Streptacidiphilus sp. EB129 TaxID=3156262 RepID=UPI003519BCA1